MTSRVFRAKKSEWLLWVFYFLAFFTVISFAIIFARFVLQALIEVASSQLGLKLLLSLLPTLKLLGLTYLWVLPWAFLLTIFYFMDERDWKRQWGRFFLKMCLRISPLAMGVMVFYLMANFSETVTMSLIIGLIALPRLLFGWISIVQKTPKDLLDTGLSLGMSRWQLLRYVYLKREGLVFFHHLLRVTCLLLGVVAPIVFLTSESKNYLSLLTFQEMILNPEVAPLVWSSLLLLFVFTFLLSSEDRYSEAL